MGRGQLTYAQLEQGRHMHMLPGGYTDTLSPDCALEADQELIKLKRSLLHFSGLAANGNLWTRIALEKFEQI
ncbi:hypothetical protein MAR_010287 [Mya arenaria]|uniref:Uncharacterized protein n=1 Tax=Mya arenaria TaxID=6604 RepID=A0ABY7E3E3_MYAAR|nr:hypothetical protein MAR_010287 [Mya arenaria]